MPGRPATDDTPGSGGPRAGAGRPRTQFTAKLHDTYIMERESLGPPQLWRVLSVSENEVEFQSGDDIIVLRLPDSE